MLQLGKIWPFSWVVRLFGSKPRKAPAARALPSVPPAWEPIAPESDEDVTQLRAPQQVASMVPPALLDSLFEPDEKDTLVDSRVVVVGMPSTKGEATRAGTLRLVAFGDGDTGKRRRQNEDSLLQLPEHGVYAVADGMGAAGQLASTVAVSALREAFETGNFSESVSADATVPLPAIELARAVARANRRVRQAAEEASVGGKTGTTLLAARFTPADARLYLTHVGDSRCYRLRGGELVCLTTDQTMRLAGLRGAGANDLLQAVGITRSLQIDLLVEEPRPGDTYLMCSDGLPKMLDTLELAEVLGDESEVDATVYALIERANDRGGKDNVSAIVLRFADEQRPHAATVPEQARPESMASPSAHSAQRPSLRWLTDGVSRESGAFRTDLGALDEDATTIARVPYDKSKRA